MGRGGRAATEILDAVSARSTRRRSILRRESDEAYSNKKGGQGDWFRRILSTTLRSRELLGFLANNNLIPKYGFPVDTVEMVRRPGQARRRQRPRACRGTSRRRSSSTRRENASSPGGKIWTIGGAISSAGKERERPGPSRCAKNADDTPSHSIRGALRLPGVRIRAQGCRRK